MVSSCSHHQGTSSSSSQGEDRQDKKEKKQRKKLIKQLLNRGYTREQLEELEDSRHGAHRTQEQFRNNNRVASGRQPLNTEMKSDNLQQSQNNREKIVEQNTNFHKALQQIGKLILILTCLTIPIFATEQSTSQQDRNKLKQSI